MSENQDGSTTLYVIRHAWALPRDPQAFPDDGLRPLTNKGRRRFRRLIRKLVKRGFSPGLVATSPLVRCRQTAEIIAEELKEQPRIAVTAALAPGGAFRELWEWTRQQPELREIAWVGHAPEVGRFIGTLIGEPTSRIEMKKGAAAALHCADPTLPSPQCTLHWLVTAKLLGC